MNSIRNARNALFLAAAFVPLTAVQAQAQSAACAAAGAAQVSVGTVAAVAPGAARSFTLSLAAGEGVIVDLSSLAPKPQSSDEGDDHDDHEHDAAQTPVRSLKLCDAGGKLLAPQAGEVFEKGGSITSTDDGERLRFLAPAAGQYVVTVTADAAPRELLVRRRAVGMAQSPVISAALDAQQKGIVSSKAPMVFSFTGTAGQWVELKSTSEKDTLLRRKLPIAGTYFVQVDSLSDEAGEFTLALKKIAPPPPPAPPVPLRAGVTVGGKLANQEDARLYALALVAGHSYRLDLTAPYDGVVAIGSNNPIEADDGNIGPDAGFAEIKSQDSGTSGTEKLTFTARANGTVLVRVKSFGIGESDGGYTLTATDLGG